MRLLLFLALFGTQLGCSHLTYVSKKSEVEVSAKRFVRKDDGGVELALRHRGSAPSDLVLVRVRDCVYAIDKTTREYEDVVLSPTARTVLVAPAAIAVGVGAMAGMVVLADRASVRLQSVGEPIFWLGLGAGAVVFLAVPTYNVLSRSDPVVTRETENSVQTHCSEERPTGVLTGPGSFKRTPVEAGKFDIANLADVEGPDELRFDGAPVRMAENTAASEVGRVISCAAVARDGSLARERDRERCRQPQGSSSTPSPRGNLRSFSP